MVMAECAFLFLCLAIFLSSAWAARHADPNAQNVIKFLPGFQGPLPFHLETGYVGVGEFSEFQLFYYFAESEKNPSEDPLLLWLTGGPGCSALSGLIFEIGPLTINKVEYNGSLPTLTLNQYSWNKIANVIFLDSPVGTGFSYARGIQDYEMGDIRTVKLAQQFLRKWLADHPQFLPSPIYICGDSYSGIPVPILTLDILNGNEAGQVPPLNLKGYLLGNALTDSRFDLNSEIPYAHRMGLISDELFEVAKRSCKGNYINVENEQCAHAVDAVNECLSGINKGHILEPVCAYASPKSELMGGDRRFFLEMFKDDPVPNFTCRIYKAVLQ